MMWRGDVNMDCSSKGDHFTLEERKIIENGIRNGATKTAIAITLGKDNSSVGKEIAKHRIRKYKCALPLECASYKHCKHVRTINRSSALEEIEVPERVMDAQAIPAVGLTNTIMMQMKPTKNINIHWWIPVRE